MNFVILLLSNVFILKGFVMRYKNKFIFTLFTLLLFFGFTFSAFSFFDNDTAKEKLLNPDYGLIIISHRGDTAFYPENSLDAIKSAFKSGADFVSIELENTDGDYFISDGTSLKRLIKSVPADKGLIIDVSFEEKDGVYEALKDCDGLDKALLRMEKSGKDIAEWNNTLSKKVGVIGVYSGNFIFSTVSNIKALTRLDTAAVQYESKNYFNVAYGDFFTSRYLNKNYVRAIASTYSPDLCGQRSDGPEGWDELILKGYSIIETNNTQTLSVYRAETQRLQEEITELLEKSKAESYEGYSQACVNNLLKAQRSCEAVFDGYAVSLNEASSAYSSLILALNQMELSDGNAQIKGALNVTAGKVVAAVLVGAFILAGQIYVYKMRKVKK